MSECGGAERVNHEPVSERSAAAAPGWLDAPTDVGARRAGPVSSEGGAERVNHEPVSERSELTFRLALRSSGKPECPQDRVLP